MASRIPGFTSGLKPPTSQVTVTKRRGIEPAAGTQPVDKRPRTAEDAQTANGVNKGVANKLTRSKSVSSLVSAQSTRPGISRAPTTMSRPASSTTLNRTTASRTTACANITKRVDSITNAGRSTAIKGKPPTLESRMMIIEKRLGELEQENTEKKDTIVVLDSTNKSLESNIKDKETAVNVLSDEIESTKKKMREMELASATEKTMLEHKIRELEFQKSRIEREKQSLEGDLIASQKEVIGLKCSVSELSASSAGLRAEFETVQRNYQTEKAAKEKFNALLDTANKEIDDLKANLRQEETLRRQLHNTVQELKGNIRVFCRIRTILPCDKIAGSKAPHLNVLNERSMEVSRLSADATLNESSIHAPASGRGASKFEFSFDRVFGPSSKQEHIFDEISQLVQSAIDGYNVCIFAYGQTGSGKTFTMEGGDSDANEGMIPRSVRLIFATCNELKSKGWTYKIEASFLEIYNEQIRDLLGNGSSNHEIRLVNNEVVVTNLRIEEVTNEGQVNHLLARAQQQRAVAATSCNEHSSRSHSVLRLKLSGINSATTETSHGVLYMVDLAGSERLKESGATGDRLTETKHINRSLSNLGNVIMALSSKEQHIPFRNSKLTFLLQQALGGSAKTLMFVNVSPKESCTNETINSLRFAAKVNQCHIGTAVKNNL